MLFPCVGFCSMCLVSTALISGVHRRCEARLTPDVQTVSYDNNVVLLGLDDMLGSRGITLCLVHKFNIPAQYGNSSNTSGGETKR